MNNYNRFAESMTRVNTLNYCHESKNEIHCKSKSQSLMAMVIDGFRRSRYVQCPKVTTSSVKVPMTASILELLDTLEGPTCTNGAFCSDEHFIDGGNYHPAMLEPAPLNIPDNTTMAQASGPFHVVKELNSTAEIFNCSLPSDMDKTKQNSEDTKAGTVLTSNGVKAAVLYNKHAQDQSHDVRIRCYQSLMWNKRFNDLDYQKRTGSCHGPLTYSADPTLVRWVKRQ